MSGSNDTSGANGHDGIDGIEPVAPELRSPGDFEPALLWVLGQAIDSRARRITCVDPDFAAWPLDHAPVLDRLAAWLRLPQRRLVLVARDFSQIPRRHPRFVARRRDWSHAVDAWAPSEGVDIALPTLLFDDRRLCLQVYEPALGRGRITRDESVVRQWRDEVDALLQRCEAAFPAHHLGL